MRIDQALEQISEIHEHLARSQLYRGYRALPAAAAGVLALIAAWVQPPITDPRQYIGYWILVAVAAFLISVASVVAGYVREHDAHARRRTRAVVGQLAPSLAVGLLLTVEFLALDDDHLLLFLPAIWALLYGLGLVASTPFLPKRMGGVALFYLLCGGVLLHRTVGGNTGGLSPWDTGFPFGVGQVLSGLILYWNLERPYGDL